MGWVAFFFAALFGMMFIIGIIFLPGLLIMRLFRKPMMRAAARNAKEFKAMMEEG